MNVQTKHLSDGLNRVLQTFKKFLPYLQNTCEYPTLSNGPIEGINNKIKYLKETLTVTLISLILEIEFY